MTEKNIKILHIASDEKFIDAANYIFEQAFPGCNHFLVPKSRYNQKLLYIKSLKNIEIVPYTRNLISYLAGKTHDFDCVILHGITEINSTVFLMAQEKSKFIGFLWGAELYTEENFSDRSLTGELTKQIKLPKTESSLKERVKNNIRKIIYYKSITIKDATKLAASGLSYFGVPYEEEFDNFRDRKVISENCCYIPFTYYPVEFIMKGNELLSINGNNILVGNSSLIYNNHLEAFEILKNINIGDRLIFTPLSYGNTLYADYIQEKGYFIFKNNFKPLRKFMPLDEYTRAMQSCGIVIMNHYRQQGVGNVLMMLYLGSKVYLNESNTLFHYLKRIGIKVFSIEKELIKDNELALVNLSKDVMAHNRTILTETFKQDLIINKLKEAICTYF